MQSQLGCCWSVSTGLWKLWPTLEEMVVDEQGAYEGSLQSCWLHSCWWSYWWKQRNSCLCGHCWHQLHLHLVLGLLHSQITEKDNTAEKMMSDHFQDGVFHSLRLSFHFSLSCFSPVPDRCSRKHSMPTSYGFLPCQLPNKVKKHTSLCTASGQLFPSTLLHIFIVSVNTIWQFKEGLFY